jgi:hypothetical protein
MSCTLLQIGLILTLLKLAPISLFFPNLFHVEVVTYYFCYRVAVMFLFDLKMSDSPSKKLCLQSMVL